MIEINYTSNISTPAADLLHMIAFAQVITDMQITVIEMRKRNASKEVIKTACQRIDKLINIYERFDKLYFNVNFHIQKNYLLQKDKIELQSIVANQKKEIEKLTNSLEWK